MLNKLQKILRLVQEEEFEVLVILGPTAVGKTSLAIDLAKKLNAEIISADSRMIYRKMDIGTSKPNLTERQGIPHHLLDLVNPDESFNVSDFKKQAIKKIIDIKNREKIPILVGGTMLYLDAVIDNYIFGKTSPNLELRKQLESFSKEQLYSKLETLDPNYAKTVDKHNLRRLIRPLEIILTTGEKYSEIRKKEQRKFKFLKLGIFEEREKLYEKINQRVDDQLKMGLLEETYNLAEEYSYELTSMSGLGYKQLGCFLRGEVSFEDAVSLLKRDTRHFAKRQLTWWRKDQEITWI